MNAERRRAGTDASFALVVFDPPHFERNGSSGWVGLKYGTLKGDWREMLRAGFVTVAKRENGTMTITNEAVLAIQSLRRPRRVRKVRERPS